MTAENQKPSLRRLELLYLHAPRYFVTACTHNRRHILANAFAHETFLRFAKQGPEHGAWIGAYVFMPNHVHAFVPIDDRKLNLPAWGKSFKNSISKTLRQKGIDSSHWEKTFFRSSHSERRVLHAKNGITFGRILYEQGLSVGAKTGLSGARSSRCGIILSEDLAVTDRRYSYGAADV